MACIGVNVKIVYLKAEEFIIILTELFMMDTFKVGRGACQYPSGAVYDGEFKGGIKEGRGVYNIRTVLL